VWALEHTATHMFSVTGLLAERRRQLGDPSASTDTCVRSETFSVIHLDSRGWSSHVIPAVRTVSRGTGDPSRTVVPLAVCFTPRHEDCGST
jgi:hypothetical protein